MFIDEKKQSEYNVWDPFMGTGASGEAAMLIPGVTYYGSDRDSACYKVCVYLSFLHLQVMGL